MVVTTDVCPLYAWLSYRRAEHGEPVARRGVHVRSISDGIDPATPTGRLMVSMLATLAEYERELIQH